MEMTQNVFADFLGVERSAVAKWEGKDLKATGMTPATEGLVRIQMARHIKRSHDKEFPYIEPAMRKTAVGSPCFCPYNSSAPRAESGRSARPCSLKERFAQTTNHFSVRWVDLVRVTQPGLILISFHSGFLDISLRNDCIKKYLLFSLNPRLDQRDPARIYSELIP